MSPLITTNRSKKQQSFANSLLQWNTKHNKRQMPWKGEKDPYKIWLSEIILQQTRVEQGLAYYNTFIKNFPTIQKLAKATDEKVMKLWEGLGYYSRCRNLLTTARFITSELKGKFPASYDEIKALKGVGPYTAAAISSFAYNLPYAVVDGNVFRVLARVFGIAKPIDSTEGKKYFTALAADLIDKKNPGQYNQAIMDFGATVCKPAAPLCTACVFKNKCVALLNNSSSVLPVKEKKITIKKRWLYYLVVEYKGKVAIRQRVDKDIWQGLFEFPLIEAAADTVLADIIKKAEKQKIISGKKYKVLFTSPLHKQQLSHQLIVGLFIKIALADKPVLDKSFQWISASKLKAYAFPQFINQYLKDEIKVQSLF
jgi:A/G-specific adenine glycosylase